MKRGGFWLMMGGFLLAFLPVFIAVIGGWASGTSSLDESSGFGAYLWLLILTFPAGLGLGTVGFVLFLVGASRERQTKTPPAK
jgi:hypothetical protein